MMKPILADLKKKFTEKFNMLFVHVGQEEILGARFGIQVIPVQVFFDKKGREVFQTYRVFPSNGDRKKTERIRIDYERKDNER